MKSFRNSIFLLALTSLPLTGADLFAQSAEGNMRLGYCTSEFSSAIVLQGENNVSIGQGAVYFTSDLLNKYVGDKITSVEFAVKPRRGRLASVFVCDHINYIQNTLRASGSTTEYEEGWNTVKLDKPVTIVKDMNLYVGYQIMLDQGEPCDFVLFDQSQYAVPDNNLYGYNNGTDNWYDNTDGINHNVCVRAVIEGDNSPENDLSLIKISPVDGSDYVTQNAPKSYYAYVQNNGKTPVTSLSMTVNSTTSKQTLSTQKTFDGFEIPNNEPQRILLEGLTIPVEGNVTNEFTISKVNGNDDPYTDNNTISRIGYSVKEGSEAVPRKVLFEEFVSEGYDNIPAADEMYTNVFNERDDKDDFVWVKHHRNYGSLEDQFVIGEDADFAELYGKAKKPFVPAVCIDRLSITGMDDPGPAYFVDYEEQTDALLSLAKTQLSFVTLNIDNKLEGNKLGVKVYGHAGVNEMPLQDDLRLNTWLVEDNVVSTEQEGATGNSYVQNGVLRKVLSSNAWGDNLDISNYDFEKSYTVDLQEGWNPQNMRVVTFVSNYNTDALKRRVYNTQQLACTETTGIASATTDSSRPFSLVGGVLFANKGFSIVEVTDVAGRQVNPSSLGAGLYLVKATDGTRVFTQKVIVKH